MVGKQDPEGQDPDEVPLHEREALLGEGPQARVGALPPLLEEGRRQLDQQHEHVDGDAERHLELRGVAPAPEEDRHLPQLPETAEVHGDGQDGEAVAEEAGQDRRADERVVLALVQDVDEQRDREAAAAERGARDHVERDPDAPRVAVVQVAHRGEAGGEAPEHHHAAEGRDRQEDPVGAGQDGPAHLGVKRRCGCSRLHLLRASPTSCGFSTGPPRARRRGPRGRRSPGRGPPGSCTRCGARPAARGRAGRASRRERGTGRAPACRRASVSP